MSVGQVHRLGLGEELAGGLAQLPAAGPAVLHAAERDLELDARRPLIDADDAGSNLGRELHGPVQIAGEQARAQPVRSVVGQMQGLVEGVDRQHRHHRAKTSSWAMGSFGWTSTNTVGGTK